MTSYFFCSNNYSILPKSQLFCTKENQIFDKLLPVLLLLMLPFSVVVVSTFSTKQVFLKNLQKFTEKHLCRGLCFNEVGLQALNFIKGLRHRCFPVKLNFAKSLRTPNLQNISELLLLRFEEYACMIFLSIYLYIPDLYMHLIYRSPFPCRKHIC